MTTATMWLWVFAVAKLCSWIFAIIKAGIPHLLALLITLGAGLWIYRHGQKKKLNRSLAALLFDSSQNLAILVGAVRRGSWGEYRMSSNFTDPTIAKALLSDTSVFSADLDRGLVMAMVQYAQEMDATRRAMQFMGERLVGGTRLTEQELKSLDRNFRSGIATTRVLQRHLDSEISKRKIRLGTREEARRFTEELKREREEIESEVFQES